MPPDAGFENTSLRFAMGAFGSDRGTFTDVMNGRNVEGEAGVVANNPTGT